MNTYQKWFNDRHLDDRPYQLEALEDINKHINCKKVVLASCPGSGKTNMSIAFIDQYLQENPNARVLVLPHGTNILESQFLENLNKLQPNFTFSQDYQKNTQVLVSLPQGIYKKKIGRFDLIVVDEAHQFYNAEMAKTIIKKIKPKHQLLLTGTPSPFVKQNLIEDEYHISIIDMHTLFQLGFMEDVNLENATTTYQYDYNDYNGSKDLLTHIQFSQDETDETLNSLIKQICKRLTSALRTNPKVYGQTKQLLNLTLSWKTIGKTLFVAKDQRQAKQIRKYFDNNKIKNKLSISDYDSDSSQITDFKHEDDCPILIVCNRANIGFDYPELVNVVDLSGTANPDRLYQMFSRLVRKRKKKGPEKFFFKVVPNNMSNYFRYIMEGMLHLTHKDFLSVFNGKNFDMLQFPIKEKETKPRQSTGNKKKKAAAKPKVDFIPSISIGSVIKMNELLHSHAALLNGYAYITLGDVKRQLFDICKPPGYWTYEKCKEDALKFKTRAEWHSSKGSAYNKAIDQGWFEELTAHMPKPLTGFKPFSYDECKTESEKYNSRSEWMKYSGASYDRARENNWLDELMPSYHKKFTLKECREDALKYKTKAEWWDKNPRLVGQAVRSGFYDKCTKHMPERHQPHKLNFTEEECKQHAIQCTSKGEWSDKFPKTYSFAGKNKKLFAECCKHMTRIKAQPESKITYQYDINLNFIKKWEYISEIERQLNLSNIGWAAKHNSNKPEQYKLRGGFIFTYTKIK